MGEPRGFAAVDAWVDRLLDNDPAERQRLLSELRQTDPDLAHTLASLLGDMVAIEGFLAADAECARDRMLAGILTDEGWRPAPATDRCGEALGSYRLEAVIGRGYKSVVYRARRIDGEWDEVVAVKVMSRGVDTDDVLRRFLAERQLLTMLRHPNIATLLDGGVTPDGLPYFAMEFIEGESIDAWCDRHALGLDQRLRLFREVATVVAFAHRRLVVHRDIKPSNILVNGDGHVKLLDFGIAKWLDPQAQSGLSARTGDMVRPMTPAYAAPEQQSGDEITTATDVYQLGLLLATLLCAVSQPRRALDIGEDGAPRKRPSRIADPGRLPYSPRNLRGDLDWIMLKALSPAPEERYGSAAELLADLDAHLAYRPISACAPGVRYTLGKFVRRRPLVTAVTGVLVIALVAGMGLVTHYNRQLEHEKHAALDALDRAQETRNLLVRFITEADPFSGNGPDARIRDALVNAGHLIEAELASRPELRAELYGVLADAWWGMSEREPARAALQKQVELLAATPGSNPLQLLVAKRKLLLIEGRDDEVDQQLDELGALGERLATEFPRAIVERAIVEKEIGRLKRRFDQPAQALPHFEAAVAMLDTNPSPDPQELAFALIELGDTLDDLQRHEESLALIQRALDIRIGLFGEEHAWTLTNRMQLAAQLSLMGRPDEALVVYEELVPVYERRLGRLHAQTLVVMSNQGMSYMVAQRYEEAAVLFTEVLARKRESKTEPDLDLADSLQNLGSLLVRLERIPEAIEHLEAADAVYREVLKPGNPLLAYPHLTLAAIYASSDNVDGLEMHSGLAESYLRGNVPENHPAWLKTQCLVGDALLRRGEVDEGERRVKAGLEGLLQFPAGMFRHIDECRAALARAGIEDSATAS